MATQKENKFIKINVNDDFKQYAWVLESYDVKAAFNDFLRIEQGIQTEGNEDILNELYKQFLETKSSDHMTQLQFDVLNYILKYESGVYKKGEVIADIVDPKDGTGTFTIDEPGYYYIEVAGNAGNSSGNFKNYLSDGTAVTSLENEDVKLYVRNDLKFNLITGTGNDTKRIGGYVELNKKYAFFYSVTEKYDKSKDYSNYTTGFSDISGIGLENASFYDYATFEDDIFNKNFFNITFVEKGISLHRVNITLNYKNYVCGLSKDEIKSALSEIDKDKCKHYYDIIEKNISQTNCKTLGYSSVIETNSTARDSILHQNELHGGDGGFINSVIKITKPLTLSYSLSPIDSNKKNSLKCDFFEMIAEAGGSLTSTSDKYKFNDVDDYTELSLNDSIDGHKFSNQVGLTTKFDSHIGESIDHDVLCGCGRGIYKDSNGVVQHVFYGGGAYGEGIRLNEFGTAYYQEKDIGHIRIKYLGSQYCKTQAFNYDSEHKEDISLYTNEKIPVSDNIDIKLNLRKLYGCFDKNGIEEIIEPVSRHLNYIDAKLITKNVTDKIYVFKHNDNQYVSFEPLTEEYSYVNNKNTNECEFNNILFGTGKELTIDTIMKNNSECFDLKFIYAYNFVINPNLNMVIHSFKNSKLTIDYSEIHTNVKIFKKYSEILSISFLLKNTLELPEIIDSFGDVTHVKDQNAKIKSIEYKTDYGDESKLLSYADGQTIYVSKGTTFYIKFNFSSPRIVVDENASSFSGKVSYMKKNLKLNGENILDHYFDPSNDINFQYVIFSPSFSQDVSVFVKKYVFTFKIIQDLYRNLVVNNVSLKNEFEVGECCEISFNLKNYERISHLNAEIDKDKITYLASTAKFKDGQYYVPNYTYTESTKDEKSCNKFESFIAFYDKDELDSKSYNFCDKRINDMLNREGCFGKNKGDAKGKEGLFVLASRDINKKCYTDNFASSFGPQINIIAINNNKNLVNELITIRLHFKESNIKLRLSSDYCNGEEVFTYENGESGIVSFFKPYSFVIEIVGGPTGNGENASQEKVKGYKDATMGFFGGDGYVGGNGGCSGDTTYWGPSKSGWHFAITDLHLQCSWGIEEAYGGRGFMKCGGIGSEGKNLLTHNQQHLFGENERPDPWTDKCNWYAGIPIVRELSIYKTTEDFKPITFYFKAGIQGLNLINSSGDGRGGGGGLPSFITAISNNSFFEIKRRLFDDGTHKFGSYGRTQFTTISPKTGLVVEGGIPGATRGVDVQKAEFTRPIWSLSDMFNIAQYEQNNQYEVFHPYSWVNGHKDHVTSYEMFYRVKNTEKEVGYERLLNNGMGDNNKPLFSSTGYCKFDNNLNFQQKFKSLSSFDKNYMSLVRKNDSNKYEFNENTIVITNTENEFAISANNHTQENNISNRYLSFDNFIGKAFYSYESGIIRLTVQNNLKIGQSIDFKNAHKVDYNEFINGECEAIFMAPYYSNELSEEALLEQLRKQKISDKVNEFIAILTDLNDEKAKKILEQMNELLKTNGDEWYVDYYDKNRETFEQYKDKIEYELD